MKRFLPSRTAAFLVPITAALLSLSAGAQEIEPYFPKEEMPDLVKCLPGPPDTTGTDFANDIIRYMWGKEQRKDPERAAMAIRDSYWDLDTLFAIFSGPMGVTISKEGTPEIYEVLTRGITTIENIRIQPKAHYFRLRPYTRFKEHMLTPWDEEWLAQEGSFPSGHTIRSWGAALLMAEINPAASEAIFDRAWKYGESRVICGAHWQSDVDISRPAAGIGYAKLQTSPAFREQMERAKAEFRQLTNPAAPEQRKAHRRFRRQRATGRAVYP